MKLISASVQFSGAMAAMAAGLTVLMVLPGCGRKKYENPITKDTLQPDKVLYDKAITDIEKSRYEVARLTLNTLINTYDTSEYLAKAKLAVADSWYREGGSHALAQAEAEYKDFILFYPMMEESAEAQNKICMIHYKQMEKPDRDIEQAMRADDECRQLLVQFPNSRFAPEAQQRLREIQEVLAEAEYRVGSYYFTKGSLPAAANRLQTLSDHYPLFTRSDEALLKLGDSYSRMGPRFRNNAVQAYAKLLREYPLSALADQVKKKLTEMEAPVPEPDPVALARMKYEQENLDRPGLFGTFWGMFSKAPREQIQVAAKSGAPVMSPLRPAIPATVPGSPVLAGAGAGSTSTDVTVSTVPNASALDTKPDARQSRSGEQAQNPPEDTKPQKPEDNKGK